NGAQSFLRLREQRTLLFLDSGGLRANAFGKKIDRAEKQGNDGKGKQRQLPVESQHDGERAKQRNARANDVCEAFIINGLDRLRIISDTKTGIGRTAGVMKLEREALQMRVELGPQAEQRFEPDFHKDVITGKIQQAPKKLDHYHRQAEKRDYFGSI